MKKIINLTVLCLVLLIVFTGCGNKKLDTPTNVVLSDTGLLSWDAVENAESYTVTINDETYTTKTNYYQVESLSIDFTYSVTANAKGYESSLPSEKGTYLVSYNPPVDTTPDIAVAISGKSEVRHGSPITLTAHVSGTEDQTVMWTVVSGGDLVTINPTSGKITANSLNKGGMVKVRAISLADESCYGEKVITVLTPPELTQDMIDALAVQEKLGFEGYINISLYTIGLFEKFYMSSSTTVKTSLDGEHWYAEYDNLDLGIVSSIYYRNDNGIASQVGVSLENEEEYAPMLDDYGNKVTWSDSGLYNNFKGLKVSDFKFNEEKWCYEYVGADKKLPQKMVSAANPYDFKALSLSLIIEDGEILGIRALSDADYGIASGYKAIQELIVAVNFGETVDVPTISKYNSEPIHDPLREAIENMQALESYQVDYVETSASYLTSGYVVSGFTETVTKNLCYFDPFNVRYSSDGQEIRNYTNVPYGYVKVSDTLYNAFYSDGADNFNATRAWEGDFDATKPSFAFAAEIFRQYYEEKIEKEDGTEEVTSITYYVDEPMCSVASTFYYGVGNDIQLYGIFATTGYLSDGSTYTPFVVIEQIDGEWYITEACFYFYLGSIYGVAELKYSNFNSAEVDPEEAKKLQEPNYKHREIPTRWDELTIIISKNENSIEEDEEIRADKALKEFFGDDEMAEKLPFFGEVLGDTYGFGLSTFHIPTGADAAKPAIVFYYDVPLDMDYTIDSSLNLVYDFLIEEGFTRTANGEFVKGNLHVSPQDVSLDFTIYVWVE